MASDGAQSSEGGGLVIAVIVFGLFVVWGAIEGFYRLKTEYFDPKPAAATTTKVDAPPPVNACSTDHRFERTEVYPVGLRADIALDSCTGQVCRTWDWALKGPRETAWSSYESAPLCSDLAKQR